MLGGFLCTQIMPAVTSHVSLLPFPVFVFPAWLCQLSTGGPGQMGVVIVAILVSCLISGDPFSISPTKHDTWCGIFTDLESRSPTPKPHSWLWPIWLHPSLCKLTLSSPTLCASASVLPSPALLDLHSLPLLFYFFLIISFSSLPTLFPYYFKAASKAYMFYS